tara:strand:- start:79 stop:609 length:531 start_codon:yes stop_codon:yes gene_type:complete
MKKTIMTVIAVFIIGCGSEADAKTTVAKETTAITNVIIVPNTETISYHLYRQLWREANGLPKTAWEPDYSAQLKTNAVTPLPDNPVDVQEIVEIELSDLKFKDAFRIEFLSKGEGHTFWWRGQEYTTNLIDELRRPLSDFKQTDPFIERITNPTTVLKAKIAKEDVDATTPKLEEE